MYRLLIFCIIFLGFISGPATATNPVTGHRVALIIGNSSYQFAPDLVNPSNDAELVASKFEKIGFTVLKGIDLDKAAMNKLIRKFAHALRRAKMGIFFYAGHGVQISGKNYLVPIDAKLEDEFGIDFELVQLGLVQRTMERASKTNLIFLDACRNNPLSRNLARAMGTRSVAIGRGFAPVESGVGTLISFSTQPGNVALDGLGTNSPYALSFARHIDRAGIDISDILIRVRNDVMRLTNRRQIPWEHSALTRRLFFVPQKNIKSAPVVGGTFEQVAELSFWNTVKDSKHQPVIDSYLKIYPNGMFASVARTLSEQLKLERAKSKNSSPGDQKKLAKRLQGELKRVGCYAGAIDGDWGRGSKRAMANFNRHANTKLETRKPGSGSIRALRNVFARICPKARRPVAKTKSKKSKKAKVRKAKPKKAKSVKSVKAKRTKSTRTRTTSKKTSRKSTSSRSRGGLCIDGNMDHCRLACSKGYQKACRRLGR